MQQHPSTTDFPTRSGETVFGVKPEPLEAIIEDEWQIDLVVLISFVATHRLRHFRDPELLLWSMLESTFEAMSRPTYCFLLMLVRLILAITY